MKKSNGMKAPKRNDGSSGVAPRTRRQEGSNAK
jgi:hypothetical protein